MTHERYEQIAEEADRQEYLLSELSPAEVTVGPTAKSVLAIRMDGDDIERLRARAVEDGVGLTQLARSWIMERLDSADDDVLPANVTESLGALRRAVIEAGLHRK